MKIQLLCVGRRVQGPLLDALDDFAKRLSHYVSFEIVRLKESDKSREAGLLLGKLEPKDYVVVLDERGAHLTSMALADAVRRWQQASAGRIIFIIGGACGLEDAVKKRAQAMWCLSALTLPHRLAQLLLTEQLYRAHTIIRGEKYHKA